jgi:hypothetical protein
MTIKRLWVLLAAEPRATFHHLGDAPPGRNLELGWQGRGRNRMMDTKRLCRGLQRLLKQIGMVDPASTSAVVTFRCSSKPRPPRA